MMPKAPSRFLEPSRTTSCERLREIEAQSQVRILRLNNQQFDKLYDDWNSLVVWRPRPPK